MDQQQHEERFIQDHSIISSGAQDIRNNGNNKKVSRYGQSISRFRGGRGVTSKRNMGESRDDGDQQHSRQLEEQSQNSIIIHAAGSFVGTNPSDTNTASQRDYSSQESRRGLLLRGYSNGSSSSVAPVSLELLLQQRQQLTERLQELETQFDSIQKQKAYERGIFAMKRGQLMVEIEGLREDHVFLTKKRDKLGSKLLAIHLKRVERMESDKQFNERDARQIQRSGSQTSF